MNPSTLWFIVQLSCFQPLTSLCIFYPVALAFYFNPNARKHVIVGCGTGCVYSCVCVPWSVPLAASGSADRSSSWPVIWSSGGSDRCTCRWWESSNFWSGRSSPTGGKRSEVSIKKTVKIWSNYDKNVLFFLLPGFLRGPHCQPCHQSHPWSGRVY